MAAGSGEPAAAARPATLALWSKDLPLDALVHRFTVGDDPDLDRRLLLHDCLGSGAHARMLERIGVLSSAELALLLTGLSELHAQAHSQSLTIPTEMEDGHTLIEQRLSARDANSGGKIHTGRSRNDQVALAQNLYLRSEVLARARQLLALAQAALHRAKALKRWFWPGYSHIQRAMPSSAAQWLSALAEAASEEAEAGLSLWHRMRRCPLGAAAGYGVPLPLDRRLTARLLGYSGVHVSPMDALAARPRHAQAALDWFASCGALLERFAWDVSLMCSAEFGFLQLPDALTTGSSIMPQKRNPDVAELLRAHGRQLRGLAHSHAQSAFGLPSGYHRDWQLGKGVLIAGNETLAELLGIAQHLLANLGFVRERAKAALTPELYATAAAYQKVRAGQPFRQAYREVGSQVLRGEFQAGPELQTADPGSVSLGSPERLGLPMLGRRAERLVARIEAINARSHARQTRLLDPTISTESLIKDLHAS